MAILSKSNQTYIRFRKNIPAVCGLIFILIIALIALLGYLLTPDETPLANKMNIQLSISKPGSSFMMLKVPKLQKVVKVNFLEKIIGGQPPSYNEIPVAQYKFSGSKLFYREFLGEGEQSEIKSIPLQRFKSTSVKEIKTRYFTKHTFLLGTDIYGRDLLSRLIIGARISLIVGFIAVIISLLIGVTLGALAGYFGGWVDNVISWFMNVLWSLPALLLVIAISFALGKGFWQVFIAIGLSTWVEVARLVRGQVMALKKAEFIEAAKALGFSNSRIIIKHILPNISGPVLVVASSNFASAILLEAGLSFLGFGAQPPTPTWGGMIREHYGYIIIDAAYLAVLPGVMIMLLVYAFNLLSVGLRDAFDIQSQNTNV